MSYVGPYGYQYGMGVPTEGYTPNYYQQQTSTTPLRQSVNSFTIPEVYGRDGAIALGRNLGPNGSIIAIDKNSEDVLWVVANDSGGSTSIRKIKFIDADEEPVKESTEDKNPSYVTFSEFDKLRKQVDNLVKELGGKSDDN